MKVALEAGIDHTSMQTEHRGSEARRVQCVHCKGITETVTTQPVTCAHCGLTLLVRDHYSRRIAAFQGVCIDAEEPGVVPADRGGVPMSDKTPKIAVAVTEISEITPLIKRFRLEPIEGGRPADLLRRRSRGGRDAGRQHPAAQSLFADEPALADVELHDQRPARRARPRRIHVHAWNGAGGVDACSSAIR